MTLNSRILIDKSSERRKPFKTRQDVMKQVNEILDLIEMGEFDRAEHEARILDYKMDMMLEKMRNGKLKLKL